MEIDQIATIGIFLHFIFGTTAYCPASGMHSLEVLSEAKISFAKVSSEAACKCRILRKLDPGDFVLSLSTDQDVTIKSILPAEFKAKRLQTLKYFEFENMNVLLSPADVTISFTLEHSSSLLTGTCCCQTIKTTGATTKLTTEVTSRAEAIDLDTSSTEMDVTTYHASTIKKRNASTSRNKIHDETQKIQAVTVTSKTTKGFDLTTNVKYQTTGCQCTCRNLTKEEALKKVEKVISEITVNKQETILAKSKRMCAVDKRMSSKAIGVCGIVILSVVFGSIVLMDVLTLCIRKH